MKSRFSKKYSRVPLSVPEEDGEVGFYKELLSGSDNDEEDED